MIDDATKERIWQQVDFALAMQGEEIDAARAREVFEQLVAAAPEDVVWPADNKKGEQTTLVTGLATRVLEELGQAPPEQVVHAVPDIGKWDDRDGAPEIIRRPIGA